MRARARARSRAHDAQWRLTRLGGVSSVFVHRRYYTNQDLLKLLTPASPSLPYVYDSFDKWGGCKWDPCPTCV